MAQGMKNTVLDHLPAGTDADLAKGKIPHTLPDGVTNRAVYQDILQIALPASVELILSSFTSMADLIMVGNLGTWAITAVGLTTQPKFILMTMVMAMNVGSTALVAQSRGSGNREAAQKYARQAMLLNLTLSILLSVVGFVTARPLVLFMGAKDGHILSAGTAYLQIQMAGFVFFSLTSTITALLRGIGDSKTAMYYNTVANLVNLILNYLLINGHLGFPRLEVAGASLATTISQIVSCILAVIAISKKKLLYSYESA